jgi:hypothetical protein
VYRRPTPEEMGVAKAELLQAGLKATERGFNNSQLALYLISGVSMFALQIGSIVSAARGDFGNAAKEFAGLYVITGASCLLVDLREVRRDRKWKETAKV